MVPRLARFILVALTLIATTVTAHAFVHPGLYNSTAELQHMATAVNANVQPQRAHYDNLPNVASYVPRSNTTVVIDLWTANPAAEYNDTREDCFAAYAAALQWVVEDDAGNTATANARAAKAIEILNHMTTITNSTGHDVQLRIAIFLMPCHGAAEIMRHVYGSWPDAAAYGTWLGNFVYPRLPATNHRFWRTSGAAARMAIGVYRDHQAQFDTGLNDIRFTIREDIRAPGRHIQTCRIGNSADWSDEGGDLPHVISVFWTLARVSEIAKHQGIDLYGYKDPADNMGIEDTLLYHDQWYGYNEGRPGASATGWPCDLPLDTLQTYPTSVWNAFANHYGTSTFYDVANWCNGAPLTNDARCGHSYFFPWEGLTHRYNDGTPPVADTTDPTVPGSPLATVNSSSQITVSWTASTDAIGVTGYRIDECSTAACTPSVQLVQVSGTLLSYAHTGLAAASLHRYRIRALDAAGNDSAQTATVEATTSAAPTPPPVSGNAIYVSPTGNNLNPGTLAQPFQTLQHAFTQLTPGATLYLRGGTYDPGAVALTPTSGTSWNAPTTVRNYPGETALITHPAGNGCYLNMNSEQKYFQMIGEPVPFGATKRIILHRCTVSSSISTPGNEVGGGGEYVLEHVEIRNNPVTATIGRISQNVRFSHIKCHDNGTGGLDHCVYTHPNNAIFEGFECYNNSGYCMQLQNTREQQGVSCPGGCGINNITIRNSVIRNNGAGGIIVRGNTGAGGAQIYNNFIYGNSGSRGLLLSNPNALMAYNTVYGNNVGLGTVTTSNCQVILNGSPQVIGNLVVTSAAGRPDFCSNNTVVSAGSPPANFSNNLFGAGINALFTNPAAGDFRLLAGSQAINAGIALAGVPRDFFSATRPVGPSYDVGAHEFGGVITPPSGDSTPPTTPTLLVLTLISPTQVNLDWADSTDGVGVTGYQVLRCSHTGASCVPSTVIASPVPSAYSDTSVVASTQYVYAVVAFDAAGNLSQASSTAGITTTTPPADITAPSVPTSPIATAIAFDQVSLTWTASTDAVGVTGYLIRRCTGGACTPSVQVDVSALASYSSLGLSASTTYGYSVAARDASNNVSAYSTTAYATTPAAAVTPSIILLLNNTTANTGTNGATPVNTSVTFTTTGAQLAEGTHAGVWNASTDVIMVPTTGFTNPANVTVALSFYAQTDFSVVRALFGHSSISPGFADRLQLRTTDAARLGVGLGDNANVNTDVTGGALSLNTLYRVWLRTFTTGVYRVDVAEHGVGIIAQAAGSYTGLSQFGSNFAIGNNMSNNTQGFLGSIDAVTVENRAWSDAEVLANCVALVSGCVDPGPPSFDPFVMVSGVQGDATAAAQNTSLTVTMTGTPDPEVCADLTQFYLAYGATREPVTSCSLNGSLLQLSVASPPTTPLIILGLTYLPTTQQIFLTNSTVADLTTGDDLQQTSWWCRRDVSDTTHWEQLPNQMCRVPSPGVINLRVDVVNVGGGQSLAQEYALYCDTDVNDATDGVRIVEDQVAPFDCADSALGLCLNRVSRGVADGTIRTPVLPNPPGVTAVSAGTLQRSNVAPITPVLETMTRTEFEFSLRVAPGIARGTTFYCGVRPSSSGAPLSMVNLAPIRVDTARFFSE